MSEEAIFPEVVDNLAEALRLMCEHEVPVEITTVNNIHYHGVVGAVSAVGDWVGLDPLPFTTSEHVMVATKHIISIHPGTARKKSEA